MQYTWTDNGTTMTAGDLARFTAAHAHEFYEAAAALTVIESDGYSDSGDSESVYREDAFSTAAEHFGVDYDVFYDAWLSGEPVELDLDAPDATGAMGDLQPGDLVAAYEAGLVGDHAAPWSCETVRTIMERIAPTRVGDPAFAEVCTAYSRGFNRARSIEARALTGIG